MTETLNFKPRFKTIGNLGEYSNEKIKNETMFFSCDKNFVLKNGDEITKNFVNTFLSDYDDWIIDSRVHMLMKGWYPCIPGFHHDDVPRKGIDNQPNYENPEYYSIHRMVVIGSSALPEFINCETSLPKISGKTKVYKIWNDILKEKYINNIYKVKNGEVIDFTWEDFHRGVQAEEDTWRLFIRASRNTDRKFHNEIRKQVNVYLPFPEEGW